MSKGPLISCSWFHDAQFHSPEGFARRVPSFKHQVYQRVARKSQLEVCERRAKSFIKYFKGPMIKMLRRNTPYGHIIYMLRLLENDWNTSFLSDLFSWSRYMKRVQLFNGRYTKRVTFVKNSIFMGKALDLEAKPLRTKLYWVASHPSPFPFSIFFLPPFFFIFFYISRKEWNDEKYIWNDSFLNCGCLLTGDMNSINWPHSQCVAS